MRVWCGIDWAERHHDVALVDDSGKVLIRVRISDDAAGFRRLLELLAEHAEHSDGPIPVAIETVQGLVPASLRAAGVQLYAINPLSVSRYRDRHAPSRSKSDAADAVVLANILRTDRDSHRPVPADSELAQAIRVLARAQQDAVWDQQQTASKLRSLLRQYFPSFLATLPDLTTMGARSTLRLAPSPVEAATLRAASVAAALRRGGRKRSVQDEVNRIVAGLRQEQLRQPRQVEAAMAQQALAYARALHTHAENVEALERAMTEAFEQHPDARIITSFPGLGTVLGARLLAEIGDDRQRFATARGLKAFAGTAPVTRASGQRTVVTMRVVRNKRLNHAAFLWALPLILHSPPAREHYHRRRAQGDSHIAASRNLANRHVGMLYHCLQSRQLYDAGKAYPAGDRTPSTTAA